MHLSLFKLKITILAIVGLAIIAIIFVAPIPQNPSFHQFADDRTLFRIRTFWNVISNLGFLLVGIYGLYQIQSKRLNIVKEIKTSYTIFFIGITLVAFGSGYYHFNPNNHTLIWDRLPMTIAFMALMSIVLAENLSITWGRMVLWPLLFIGAASVSYWYWGELNGSGDLRPYFLVQYLPMLLLPLLLLFGKPTFQNQWGYWVLLLAYILAKVFEHFDIAFFNLFSKEMAGHAIKHLLVVIGLCGLLIFYGRRSYKK
jgi:hypothetical protein